MTKTNTQKLQKIKNNIEDAIDSYEIFLESFEQKDDAQQYILEEKNFVQELMDLSIGKQLYELNNNMDKLLDATDDE